MELFGLQIVFKFGDRVVVVRVLEIEPHLLYLPLQPIFLALAVTDLLSFTSVDTIRLPFRIKTLLAFGFNSLKLYLHLIDNEQQFRLELVVDLDDAVGLGRGAHIGRT